MRGCAWGGVGLGARNPFRLPPHCSNAPPHTCTTPPPPRAQWALLYLTDDDLCAFLRRCAAAVKPGGVIVVKENVCEEGFIVDKDDASITRSHLYYQQLFQRAGLALAHTALQRNFPKGLFKVRMYALKPKPGAAAAAAGGGE